MAERHPWQNELRVYIERYAVWCVLLILVLMAMALSPVFRRPVYLMNLVRQAAPVGIAAVGLTFIMLLRGVDMSIGAVMSLTAVLAAAWMNGANANIPFVVLACLAVSTCIGLIHGLLLTRPGFPPFILTLGSATSITGLILLYTGGTTRGNVAPGFREFLNYRIGPVPVMALLLLAVVLLGWYVQKRTAFGRRVYLVGGNPQAARLAGVQVNRVTVLTYGFGGFTVGLAGLALIGRAGVSGTMMAQFAEFDAIAAVVMGGTTWEGGRGGVAGTLAGILALQIAFALVNVLGLSYYAQLIGKGVIIVGAAGLYAVLRRT